MGSGARGEILASERAISALAGYTAGSFVVVPFDRLKTLMQATPGRSPAAVALARSIFSRRGIRGLYRGLDVQLLIAPYTVMYYSVYDELLQLQDGHPLAPLRAAVLARTLEVTLRTPLELLRTQLQAAEGDVTLLELLRRQRRSSLSSWMRGYFPTLMRDVPFSGMYWFAYEEAKRKVVISERWISGPGTRTWVHSFVCGGFAGMLAALVTTPIDVAKTLRQKLADEAAAGGVLASNRDIARLLLADPRAGFAGLGPRLLRIPLGLATMMSGIETTKWLFQRERGQHQTS